MIRAAITNALHGRTDAVSGRYISRATLTTPPQPMNAGLAPSHQAGT